VSAASNQDVVVTFPGALGDAVLFLPALHQLRRRHANARLHLAVRRPLLPFTRLLAAVDDHHALDDAAFAHLLGGGAPPPWWPARPRLYSWLGTGDVQVRACLAATASEADFFGVVRDPGARHAATVYLEAVGAAADWASMCATVAVRPPPSARLAALGGTSARWLVLHRGAGSPSKCWSAAGFQDVARRWRADQGPVVDLLGPAEHAERPLPDAIPVRDWPLPDVLALLARADAYVGHDSGPSHLAAAAGCRGVVLFGPTEPSAWRPVSERLIALRDAGAGHGQSATRVSLGAERVYEALCERLKC
jgi:ADP-heptose:LPS heptosyltransferase